MSRTSEFYTKCKFSFKNTVFLVLGQQRWLHQISLFSVSLGQSRPKKSHLKRDLVGNLGRLQLNKTMYCEKNSIPPEKILLPPLHIKLGLMKQFVKSLPTDGDCFKYLVVAVKSLSRYLYH
uniref:Uncharacterized protein n=1 Tax=Cacopsylla melanoneura TaxID=428564 RepID=A0A8D9BT54_9HEMI